ncbi:MAG: toxin HicA [Chloroflexi bacterium HGW-Chloroflexi-1]|nr:MAG: toxin HicA [Chloroflexi bacterium HGW-Chloroflexi-1]
MSKQEKLLEKIRNNPKGVRFEELDLLLTWHGFERRQPRRGSSHYVYTRDGYLITVVKHEAHVHSEAVKETLEILDELSKNE